MTAAAAPAVDRERLAGLLDAMRAPHRASGAERIREAAAAFLSVVPDSARAELDALLHAVSGRHLERVGLADGARAFIDAAAHEWGLAENSLARYRVVVRQLVEALEARGVSTWAAVSVEDLRAVYGRLREAGRAPSTLANTLDIWRVIWRHLLAEDAVRGAGPWDIERPRLWRRLPTVLDLEEAEDLMNAPDPGTPIGLRDRALLELLYGAGLRVSEALGLEVFDVALEARVLRVMGKGGRERLVPIGRPAVAAVRVWLAEGRPEYEDRAPAGHRLLLSRRGGPLRRESAWRAIKRHAAAVGLPAAASPHTLRHTFAVHLLHGGATVREVQELLGHARIATTEGYLRAAGLETKRAHEAFHPRAGEAPAA